MDVGSLASAMIGAQVGKAQLAVAAKMLQMSNDSAASVAQLLDAADQNFDRLANVAAGVGTNVDVSV